MTSQRTTIRQTVAAVLAEALNDAEGTHGRVVGYAWPVASVIDPALVVMPGARTGNYVSFVEDDGSFCEPGASTVDLGVVCMMPVSWGEEAFNIADVWIDAITSAVNTDPALRSVRILSVFGPSKDITYENKQRVAIVVDLQVYA